MNLVDQAFKETPRESFVLPSQKYAAGIDSALSIGHGQTISQPTTVRMMLEWLDVQPGDKVLDVGSGSGWTTALLANIVGSKGHAYAVERVPELVEFGRENCERLSIENVTFYQAGKKFGLKKFAPYDRILVSASGGEVPVELKNQLKVGGKLVIPVAYDILELTKISDSKWDTKTHPGFIFVPLIKNG